MQPMLGLTDIEFQPLRLGLLAQVSICRKGRLLYYLARAEVATKGV